MKNAMMWIGRAVVYAGLGSLALCQDRPPDQPFRTVHMIMVRPAEEKQFAAALKDISAAIAKAGCPACGYHLWKVSGQAFGPFNYMQVADWPGREVYEKVHASDEFNAALERNGQIWTLITRGEVYVRYVEVK